jgi:hypothetical protein
MSHVRWFLTLGLLVLAFASAAVASAAGPVTINLDPQNNSGESGTATLTDLGNGKTQVEVTITGAPAGVVQPMHIHKGTCANLDPKPTYPLTSLTDGKSVTEVDVALADLQNGDFAINGHKSAQEASVYVFCGNIPAATAAALPTTGGDFTNTYWLLGILGLAVLGAGVVVMRLNARTR